MDNRQLKNVMKEIREVISENKEYLISLDQQNGDGDLGISMDSGFSAAVAYLENTDETDLGRLLNQCGDHFNEAAPSSLGTILAFAMKGMARSLKGKTQADLPEMIAAMGKGLENIMAKAGSKPGEKTVLDALCPAIEAMQTVKDQSDVVSICRAGMEAAAAGSEHTRNMKAVWGRAAYYGEKSLGIIDGGSAAGALIFRAIYQYVQKKEAGTNV